MKGSQVTIDHVSKRFGDFVALDDINFTIKNNGVVWQPDKTFLLMLVKLKTYPAGENDAGYAWW